MRRIYSYCFYIFLFIIIFSSCKNNSNTYHIEGKIKNLTASELYVVTGAQDSLKVDTIFSNKEGRFSFKIQSDSLSPVIIYLEKGKIWMTVWPEDKHKITLSGDAVYPELILVKGGGINDLLSKFKEENYDIIKERRDLIDRKSALEKIDTSTVDMDNKHQYSSKILNLNYTLKNKAENFIVANPEAFASVVLFHDYLMAWGEPQEALKYLGYIKGKATETQLYKDVLRDLNDMVMKIERASVGSKAPDFSVLAINEKDTINLDTFKDRYLLLSFTASWCEFCCDDYKELAQIRKEIGKNQLGILVIALDRDKMIWKKLVEKEKLDWKYSVDTLEWLSPIADLYNIGEIPANVLIDKNRIVVGRDLPVDSLIYMLKK
ncbi:MAG: AhpC/TSA family protein [Candidatus Azobacteroides sp.]|nr:AhpC/TSA family protein [Candidatus Azobacteroides sp.]